MQISAVIDNNPLQRTYTLRIERVCRSLLTMQRYSWEQGVTAQAFLELGDIEMAIQLARDAVKRQTPEGRLGCLHKDEATTDAAANGEAVLAAGRLTGGPAFQQAAQTMLDYLLNTAPRAADGTILHLAREVWVDSMYMAPPFLAVSGEWGEALRQIRGIKHRLWNPEKKLYSHIWDEDRGMFRRPACWGGGNGWAAAGISRVISALPEHQVKEKEALATHAREILDGCLVHISPNGLFHDVVDDPETFVETNLAQMLAYTIYKGIEAGWLPGSYKVKAERMRAASTKKVDDDGYVQGVSAAPTFDRPGTSPEGQAFFLLMEAARKGMQ